MEKVKNALEKSVQNVKEVNIPGINIRTEIMKKNWKAPVIVLIQDYWW